MNKFIAVTSVWVFSWAILICVMIYGWGLEPKSWGWIIGGGIFGRLAAETLATMSKKS